MASKPQEEEQKLVRLFSQLQVAGEDGEYERGLKIAEKILSLSPDDPDASHCKIVCLVHSSKFAEALKLIESLSRKGGGQGKSAARPYHFEKAYCLYRLERYGESRKTLESLPQEEERVKELLAQIAYRLEDYDRASAVYSSLVRECSDEFDNERKANYAAALALGSPGRGQPAGVEALPGGTMEQCFNKACCLLAVGRGREAEEALRRAEELCRESLLEEDYSEEEIESELSVIRVQLGCALQQQGRGKEALATYSAVLRQKSVDAPHCTVASNNILVLNKDRDVFDSKKKVKVLTNEGTSKKLTGAQKKVILFNRCLFALHTNQLEQCRQLVDELNCAHPDSEQTMLAKVGLLSRERKISPAIELVTSHLQTHPSSPLLYTTLAQLYSVQGNTAKVCSALRSLPSLPSHLGAVSVLVSLLTQTGSVHSAMEVLDQAVSFWTKTPKSASSQALLRSLMLHSAQYKLEHGSPQGAAGTLEQLQAEYPSDLKIRAKLVAAYSKFDSRRAEIVTQSFPAFSGGEGVNVDTLEQMPSFRHTRRQLLKPEGMERAGGEVGVREKKRKKKRKPKLPKDYDPAKQPDLERWLPLRERLYYRKGRKKGFAPLRGTQGLSHASASLSAQLDASKPKPSPAEDPTGERDRESGAWSAITFPLSPFLLPSSFSSPPPSLHSSLPQGQDGHRRLSPSQTLSTAEEKTAAKEKEKGREMVAMATARTPLSLTAFRCVFTNQIILISFKRSDISKGQKENQTVITTHTTHSTHTHSTDRLWTAAGLPPSCVERSLG